MHLNQGSHWNQGKACTESSSNTCRTPQYVVSMQGKLYKPVSNPSDPDALVASKILRWVFRSVQVLVWAWDKWRGGDEQQTGFTDMAQTAYYNWCHAILHHSLPCQATTYHTVPYHTTAYQTSLSQHTMPLHTIRWHTIPYRTSHKIQFHVAPNQTISQYYTTPQLTSAKAYQTYYRQ